MKKALILIVVMGVIGFVVVFLAFWVDMPTPDPVAIHYAMHTAMEADSVREAAIMQTDFLTQILEDMDAERRNRDNALQIFMYLFILSFVAGGIFLYLYCKRRIIQPFRKLEYFAGRIAAGNLDIPLEMDKGNLFGAFTESFDLMREELRTAKENEIKANKSKKELIASLVHDVTTPVASVRSAMDILRLKADDESEIKLLDSANKKLEQIDTLMTNMFHATLEELQELKVTPHEIQSSKILELIEQADYEKRVKPFSVPGCIILAAVSTNRQV